MGFFSFTIVANCIVKVISLFNGFDNVLGCIIENTAYQFFQVVFAVVFAMVKMVCGRNL